ncbi:MAG: glycosyltransferase family 2 protein [Myxococcota bacterium]
MERSVSIVIMAWDEEDNLPVQLDRTIAFLREHTDDWQVVVVDDGSTDRTGAIADEYAEAHPGHVDVVHHPRNLGMGAAIRHGYGAARCEWITQLPADCQIHPRTFLRFFPHMEHADLILSVYRRRDDGIRRSVLSRGFQAFIGALFGQRGDYTGTMLFRRGVLDRVGPLHADSFFVNLELPIKALRLGVPHALVEIEAQRRLHGRSKVANLRRIRTVVREALAMKRRDVLGR